MAKRMTILIRPTPDGSWIGGAIYFRNLIESIALSAAGRGIEVRIVLVYEDSARVPSSDRLFDSKLIRAFASDFDPAQAEAEEKSAMRELDVEPAVRRRAIRYRLLARHYEADFLFPYLPRFANELSCRFAAWIPDLQHVILPQFFSAEELELRDLQFSNAANYADAIVLSSNSAREDFTTRFGTPTGKLEVIRFYTLPDPAWYEKDFVETAAKYMIPGDYFMVCNQLWIHKNHAKVIEALSLLKSEGLEPTVVFTGGLTDSRKDGVADEFLQLASQAGVWNQCRILGVLPRIEQIQLLRGACKVIQPSLFEGWSTVVEDCRALGKDLLVSDLKVHREQDVPGSTFWDPEDASALARFMRETLQFPPPYSKEREASAYSAARTKASDCGDRFLSMVEDLA